MATHGTVDAFDSSKEQWSSYTERLEFYFTANGITDAAKKRAILLCNCGPATFTLLKKLIQPSKPGEKSYDEITDARLTKTLQPYTFGCHAAFLLQHQDQSTS